jgi:hypothetical protein
MKATSEELGKDKYVSGVKGFVIRKKSNYKFLYSIPQDYKSCGTSAAGSAE